MTKSATGKSPYAKHNKAPFRYSDEYFGWVAAADKHGLDSEEAMEADAAFRRRFGVPTVRFNANTGAATYARN